MTKNKEIEITDGIFELIDMIFRMHHQERMDKEEVILNLQMLLSDKPDPNFGNFIRFAYKFRDKEGFDALWKMNDTSPVPQTRLEVNPKSHTYVE